MDLGFTVSNRVGQTRLTFEWLRLHLKDPQAPHDTHYKASREKVNVFLDHNKSSASLNTCFGDIKGECRTFNADTLDELISTLSFEDELAAAILFLEDAGEWIKTVALVKKADTPTYTLIDPQAGRSFTCKTLGYDVRSLLEDPPAPFGYVVVFFKEEEKETKVEVVEEVKKVEEPKKRHRPIAAKKKKGAIGDATSEESTNK